MTFYSGLQNVASKLIQSKGKQITISRTTGATSNLGTGDFAGGSPTTQTVYAVVLPASGGKVQALDLRYKIGELTYQKLNYFIVAGLDLDFIPSPDDEVTIGSENWYVLGVTPLNPNNGVGIIYEVAIRI